MSWDGSWDGVAVRLYDTITIHAITPWLILACFSETAGALNVHWRRRTRSTNQVQLTWKQSEVRYSDYH
jgi:hypothetical protein